MSTKPQLVLSGLQLLATIEERENRAGQRPIILELVASDGTVLLRVLGARLSAKVGSVLDAGAFVGQKFMRHTEFSSVLQRAIVDASEGMAPESSLRERLSVLTGQMSLAAAARKLGITVEEAQRLEANG